MGKAVFFALLASMMTACGVIASPVSNASRTLASRALPGPAHTLYVGNYSAFTVTEYPVIANGNVGPIREIVGTRTRLRDVLGMAVDPAGYLYVNSGPQQPHPAEVDVFAPAANGDVAPVRFLNRPLPQRTYGISVDGAGYLYIAEHHYTAQVTVFAPGAHGYAPPVRDIVGPNTRLQCPEGVTTNAAGVLFVADRCSQAIFEFAPGADGDVAPIARIRGVKTQLLAPVDVKLESDGTICVIDYGHRGLIFTFASGSNGDVAPIAIGHPPAGEYFEGRIATVGQHVIIAVAGVPTSLYAVNTYETGTKLSLLRSIVGYKPAFDGPMAEVVF